MLGFVGALRPGEIVSLRHQDFRFVSRSLYLVLYDSKTSTRGLSAVQSVHVTDPTIIRFCSRLVRPSCSATFLTSDFYFRKCWTRAAADLGATKFSPASLRAGCATYLRQQGSSLEHIRWLLRHKSQATLESYIQGLAAAEAEVSVSRLVLRLSAAYLTLTSCID